MFAQARHHVGLILGPPGSYVSSIHVADAATAVAAALHAPAGTFNVVDDEPLTKREYTAASPTPQERPCGCAVRARLPCSLATASPRSPAR
ncbi:MAG TPA: hypothetical protein VIV12_17945 [Streptosporangiaceae bacterium]